MTTQVQLQVSINGGSYTTGALTASFGQSVALKAASTSGLTSIRYDIVDYPPGMAQPAGWSTDPVTNAYFFAPSAVTTAPPAFNLPASGAQNWGWLMLMVRGNNNPLRLNADGTPNVSFTPVLTDTSSCIDVLSPVLGMPGIATTLSTQADAMRSWIGPLMKSLRAMDVAASGASFSAGGDLSGTNISQNVIAVHGASVPAAGALTTGNGLYVSGVSALSYSALNLAGGPGWIAGVLPTTNGGTGLSTVGSNGQVLTIVAGVPAWANPAASYTLSGDVTGTLAATVVGKVNGATVPASGALVTGNLLQVTGIAALGYGPLNLAGGANYLTGLLPAGNQASQTMAGDVTGTTGASVVAKINGSTVPAGGALTLGNVLQVSGVSALSYGTVNLASAGSVSGILAVGNGGTGLSALGSADALLGVNHAGTALAYFVPGQDVALSSGNFTVQGLQGVGIAVTAPTGGQVLTYNSGTGKWTPTAPSVGSSLGIEFTVGTAASTSSVTSIASGSVVFGLKVLVTTPYSTGATLAIGQTGTTGLLLPATGTGPTGTSAIDIVHCPANTVYDLGPTTLQAWGGTSLPILATIGGAPATGALTIFANYTVANP